MIKSVVFILIGLAIQSSALDMELAKEGPCLAGLKPVAPDPTWFADPTAKWYTPFATKYYMYRYAEDVMGRKIENITDHDLRNFCPTFTLKPEADGSLSWISNGAGGFGVTYETKVNADGTMKGRPIGDTDWQIVTVTKGGPDYMVAINCWATGQKTFSVNSKSKKLNEADMNSILEHVKSHGFTDLKYHYHTDYDNCDKPIKESYCIRKCLHE